MADNLVFSPDSIIDLTKDVASETTGTVTISNGVLILSPVSSATFSYSFDTYDNKLKANSLRAVLDVINSNTTVNSRYDESVQVELYIQYYKEVLDSEGSLQGYELSGNDTYQINPYFIHEKDGYTNTYDITIDNNMIALIKVMYINESTNEVKFKTPKLFNSMEIMDAIQTYGGGEGPGGGSTDPEAPPLIEDLVLYSTSGDYTIGSTDGQLILQVAVLFVFTFHL